MSVANTNAAIGMLSRALFGITETGQMEPSLDPDEPTLTASEIVADGDRVHAKIHMPSGDTYELSVEWLREESP